MVGSQNSQKLQPREKKFLHSIQSTGNEYFFQKVLYFQKTYEHTVCTTICTFSFRPKKLIKFYIFVVVIIKF